MFAKGRRKLFVVFLFSLISSCLCDSSYDDRPRTLFIDNEDSTARNYLVINAPENPSEAKPRVRRQASAPKPQNITTSNKNISTWIQALEDNHQQLVVHWVGEGSEGILCLARDPPVSPRSSIYKAFGSTRPSAVYVSYDYGKTFQNKTDSFKLANSSEYAHLDKFFNHPKSPDHCVFVDSTNSVLFYTEDNVKTVRRSDLNFHPSEVVYDKDYPEKFLVLDKVDPMKKLYRTEDAGRTFELVEEFVKSFDWLSGPDVNGDDLPNRMFYVERFEPKGGSVVKSSSSPETIRNGKILLSNVHDFVLKGDFMFATRLNSDSLAELYISYKRGPFVKAEFQTELDLKRFHISDVTSDRIMVSVMHAENQFNLYVSEMNTNRQRYNFVLSLEHIMCYLPNYTYKNSWLEETTEDPFAELYRVEGVKGIYIASKVIRNPSLNVIGLEHLASVITFDHGATWSPIKAPAADEDGLPMYCKASTNCSLHLMQKFSQLYPISRSPSIVSSKSAPGLIIATGVLGKTLKGVPNVVISRDAGLTWSRVLKDYHFFNMGDHGSAIVAVKYFKSRGETRKLLYSTNEGQSWQSYQFHTEDLRVYGLMTEPGENTTTFTMFASGSDQHSWLIVTVDLMDVYTHNCTAADFKLWSPSSDDNSPINCVMGETDTYQRRIPSRSCYIGENYERPVQKQSCPCRRRDYECDFGFQLSGTECVRIKSSKYDPYIVPSDCKPGKTYNRTKGYRRIDGDVCFVDSYSPYEPDNLVCPMGETSEFLVIALRDTIAKVDLETNETTTFPIRDIKNVVAVEFDLKNNCLYWADIDRDKIGRQCFKNGLDLPEIIVETELASIEGLAFDWISNVLFFVDGNRARIEAVKTDVDFPARMRRTIIGSDKLQKPRGIVVHPKAGYLFWTDWDATSPSISRSDLNGNNIQQLFTKPFIVWPNGITIDYISDRIYWVDAMEDYIGSADLDGKYLKKIISNDERITHPFAVAVLKDRVYWDDWKAQSVFVADKDKGTKIDVLKDFKKSGLMDVKVYSHYMQHGTNACSAKNNTCKYMCLGGPQSTSSCLCPDGMTFDSGKCLCPGNLPHYANYTCPSRNNKCDQKEFSCGNGVCIPSTARCDGRQDCGDGSDERKCDSEKCPPPGFECGNRCLPPHWKCDGEKDCIDGEDEIGCAARSCKSNEFRCNNSICIDMRWRCDGDNDCKDGSDEKDCKNTTNTTCRPTDLQCGDGTCVPLTWVCDGEWDCHDGRDEKEETCRSTECAPGTFRCHSTPQCVQSIWVCDGENDCPDDSDEKNCTGLVTPPSLLPLSPPQFPEQCLQWMFHCDNGKCLPHWWRCDGVDDCGDGSDESGCRRGGSGGSGSGGGFLPPMFRTTTPKPCSFDQFTCDDASCIPSKYVCDGSKDCAQGEDEQVCTSRRVVTARACLANELQCARGDGCVAKSRVCDNKRDCKDGSDEFGCMKPNITCDGGLICDDGRRCVPSEKRCDGNYECLDRSDENGCPKQPKLEVQPTSVNESSFMITFWSSQPKDSNYSYMPTLDDGQKWTNYTWTNDNYYRFTNLKPNTVYNASLYIKDMKTSQIYKMSRFVTAKTGLGILEKPSHVEVRQLDGRSVRVLWDPVPSATHYTVHVTPPYYTVTVDETSIVLRLNFAVGKNYSFWVVAENNQHQSQPSDTATLTFDSVGDLDSIVNVSVVDKTPSRVTLKWHQVIGAEGYRIRRRLPEPYAKLPDLVVQTPNVTMIDLPPGVNVTVSLRAYKQDQTGMSFTIPLHMPGLKDEAPINLTASPLNDELSSVELSWKPPLGDRYKNKKVEYEVHYNQSLGELFNEARMFTSDTKMELNELDECSLYFMSVAVKGGPLSPPIRLQTHTTTSAVRDLSASLNNETKTLTTKWRASCGMERYQFMLEITCSKPGEPLHQSNYLLNVTRNETMTHFVRGVPDGCLFDICVYDNNATNAERICTSVGDSEVPRAVLAYRTKDGRLAVTWDDSKNSSYEILISSSPLLNEKALPADTTVIPAKQAPFTRELPASLTSSKELFVAVRFAGAKTATLIRAQTVEDLPGHESSNTSNAVVWWVLGLLMCASAVLAFVLVRRRNRNMRPSPYSLRAQEEEDMPRIHGFSDDEPLVIA